MSGIPIHPTDIKFWHEPREGLMLKMNAECVVRTGTAVSQADVNIHAAKYLRFRRHIRNGQKRALAELIGRGRKSA